MDRILSLIVMAFLVMMAYEFIKAGLSDYKRYKEKHLSKSTKELSKSEDNFKVKNNKQKRNISYNSKNANDSYSQNYNLSALERAIKKEVEFRDITTIIHFTPIDNVESIIKYGIKPISKLINSSVKFTRTDEDRNDNHLDAISLSISFPNYKMMYHKRNAYGYKFAVIEIDVNILYNLHCKKYICNGNAARGSGKDIEPMTIDAFRSLFEDNNLREKLMIPSHYTTNPQAEILFEGTIPPYYIKNIYYNPSDRNVVRFCKSSITQRLDDKYFKPRIDYDYWRGK